MTLVFWSCRHNVFLYTLAVALSFFCLGGHYSCFPAAAVRIFGLENGGQIYTVITYVLPLAAMSTFAVVKSGISFQNVFRIASVLTLINMILLYFFDETEMRKPAVASGSEELKEGGDEDEQHKTRSPMKND